LGQSKIPLFISSFDLNTENLKVWSSVDPFDASKPVWEVLRRAVAAETYFKPWKNHADAGILVNDPAAVAIAGASEDLKIDIDRLQLISIGTGYKPWVASYSICNQKLSWGVFILKSLLDGATSDMSQKLAHAYLGDKLVRFDFIRKIGWNMSDPKMVNIALQTWEPQIEQYINKLIEILRKK
jgi:patatin-like phospholipase/acyl hydrolase